MQAEWRPNEQKVLTRPEAVAAYRKAIIGTSIYRHAYDYMRNENLNTEVLSLQMYQHARHPNLPAEIRVLTARTFKLRETI